MNATLQIPGLETIQRQLAEIQERLEILDAKINPPEELWAVPDVARYCKVNEDTVRRWARDGAIPIAQRRGKKMLFEPESIKASR